MGGLSGQIAASEYPTKINGLLFDLRYISSFVL